MKFLIVLAASLAISSAQFNTFGGRAANLPPRPSAPVATRVSSSDENAKVLRYENDVGPDGSYNNAIEIDNGISAQAQGTLRDFGGNPPVIAVIAQGGFGWTSPEGQPIGITYTADENGYQPSGDAIPTPPPVPEAIARAIKYIANIAQKKK